MIKISVAMLYNWLSHQIPTFFDSNIYFLESNIVFSSLQENPLYYLQLLLGRNNYFPEPEHLCGYIDKMGYWYDFTGYTIVRINSILRLFSFGFISIHFLFFSFLSFIGGYYLYKFFSDRTDLSEYIIIGIIFLIPNVLFWTSGLHKEALIIFSLGILLHSFNQYLYSKSFKFLLISILAFIFLIHVRMYMSLVILPALIGFYINEKTKLKAIYPYLLSFVFLLLLVILYDVLAPNKLRLAYKISSFQSSFINATGNTSFEVDFVGNSWMRILSSFPEHLLNGFIYPLYNQCKLTWCRLASIDSIILCTVIFISFFKVKYKYILDNNMALFCLSIGLGLMTIIGVVVNNAGAIVRYRSVALIFIFLGLFLSFYKSTKKQ
ncbi:MAG TPA: hypothetical protein VLZ75_14045 [Chitinophagales bacterium]|nr:hypothetical protein [Chitinophagales bacterium]